VFGEVIDKGGASYSADIRGVLKNYADDLHKKKGYTLNAANEIEGFLFKGADAERKYHETGKFEYVNTVGIITRLPGDPLRTFIDTTAEVQRSMASRTRKTTRKLPLRSLKSITATAKWWRPPTRFSFTSYLPAGATNMGLSASFLPKPVVGVNGSGMHTNVSISEDGKNLFLGRQGREKLSKMGWAFLDRILTHGNDICLLLNASVNAYRRLDPPLRSTQTRSRRRRWTGGR